MTVVLPKASRGWVFDRLYGIDMNDFDVERLLPSLFYLVVTRGRQRGRPTNDPTDLARYVDVLTEHEKLDGFQDERGRRLLERWIRTSIVKMGRVGRARRDEQIEFVLPLTLLVYKTGLPAQLARQRKAHLFLYRILLQVLFDNRQKPSPQAALDAIFSETFGQGVERGPAPQFDGHYDGRTPVDLHTLLSLCFLDGFEPTQVSKRESLDAHDPVLPYAAEELGTDLLLLIVGYSTRVPVLALTKMLMALINLELFSYTQKLMFATNRLVETGELPPAMTKEVRRSEPELYVDFTRQRGSDSDEIARACVDRDLEELRAFFDNALLLRTLDRYVSLQQNLRDRLEGLEPSLYLHALTQLRQDPGIEARAQAEVESIIHESVSTMGSEAEKEEAQSAVSEALRRNQGSSLEAAVELLAGPQRKRAVQSYFKWYWNTGGLRKPYGLIRGNPRGPRNWRYAMSDELLATLVHLAMLTDRSGTLRSVQARPRVRLRDFLEFLEMRFGMIVDRPPRLADHANGRAAARINMDALKRRLHQMGFFEALSDDFTAQYLQTPGLPTP